jgi:polysaccharide pyruvyl transferase WcaK-like protein
MSDARTLTLLSSQTDFLDQLPNLGDRALFRGLLHLIERHGGCRVSHAPYKAFPHRTRDSVAATGVTPAGALGHWAARARGYSSLRIRLEDALARALAALSGPPMNRLMQVSGLAAAVRERTGAPWPWTPVLQTRLRAHTASAVLGQISGSDAALFSAGGQFADHLAQAIPGRLLELFIAMAAEKPLALVNYSISLDDPLSRALAAEVLPQATVHLVREPRSASVLTGLGVPAERIIRSVDSAFANPTPTRGLPPEQAGRIGIMVRGDRPVDIEAWATLVETLRRRFGVQVHYLHGCMQHDPPVRRALGRRCRLADDGRPLDLSQLRAALGRMALVITERYHGMVFAMQAGTPVVPIASTTHKTHGLAELADYPVPVLPPPKANNLQPLLNSVSQAWTQRAALSALGLDFAGGARAQLDRDYAELFRRLWAAAGAPARFSRPSCIPRDGGHSS